MEDIQHIPGQEARQDAPWTGTSPTRRVAAGLKRTFTLTLESYAFGPAASFAPGLDSDDAGAFAEGYRACRRTSSIRSSVLSEVGSMVPSRVPSRDWTPNDGTSSFSASVANLTKSMVGIGMLTLPRAFADCSVLLAVGALMFCGALSAVSFFLLGYCAHVTNTRTLPQLWEATVGPRSTPFVELIVLVDTSLSCVAFALLMADYATLSVGGLCPQLPELARSRRSLVALIVLSVLLPLCMAKRLSLLRLSSMVGLACTLYVFSHVVGDFAVGAAEEQVQLQWFRFRPAGLLSGTARFAVAFMAHFNAPAFYADLKGRRPSSFAAVAAIAYTIAFLVYVSFGFSGYAVFGESVPGNALASYELSRSVLLMWLGMGVCVVASFPLLFAALRDALLRLLSRAAGVYLDARGRSGQAITVVAVVLITFIGAESEDLSVVVSLTGALSGTTLAFIIPGAVTLSLKRRRTRVFSALGWVLLVVGSALAVASFVAVVCRDILEVI